MTADIALDTTHLALDEGVLGAHAHLAEAAAKAVAAMEEVGQLGFLHLEFLQDQLKDCETVLSSKTFPIRYHLVIGIGGSSLGAKTLLSALAADSSVKTFFLESTDPTVVATTLAHIVPAETLVSVISKSGNTLETLALFCTVSAFFMKQTPAWKGHFLIITDAEHGELRRLASALAIATLPVPESIGGRFSVLTAVGLVPALVAGITIRELFHGARNIERRCQSRHWGENPALALALYQYVLHKKNQRTITVIMPYSERLRDFTEWTAQLWAESIGKKYSSTREVREGFTTVKAVGSGDQHSQCQLYLEGPRNKWVLFVKILQAKEDCLVPVELPLSEQWRFLCKQSLQKILTTQLDATAQALAEQGTPSVTITCPQLSAYTLGQLFFLFELQTAYMGALYGVNAFDQPGVERIKQLTFEVLKGSS